MPLTAYATELDDTPLPAVTSSMKEEPGVTTAPAEIPTPEPVEPMMPDGAFTPDGQAEVVDWILGYDGKEFYAITTPAGNIFYLIIDHARANNNVYFLNAVTESDLIALAEKAGAPITAEAVVTPPTTQSPPAGTDEPGDAVQPTPGEAETPPQESSGGNSMIIFAVIAALAVGGAGYYIKIVRPKQQAVIDDDDEDEPEDDEDISFDDDAEDDDRHAGEDDDYIYPDDEDIEENDNMKEDDENEQT